MASSAASPGAGAAIGIDIGGSLVKAVAAEGGGTGHPLEALICGTGDEAPLPSGWERSTVRLADGAGRVLRALVLPTADLARAIEMVEARGGAGAAVRVAATGGGALKHRAELAPLAGVELAVVDELAAVARGLAADVGAAAAQDALVCNVGTGVSLVRVGAQGGVERVSGSGLGGATFWGLVRRLTRFAGFGEAVAAAQAAGRPGAADTLVGDIYGRETSAAIGLPPDLVAGFLGKLDADGLTDADVVAALLRMFASNLGQLAVLQARLLGLGAVCFTGGFVPSAAAAAAAPVRQALAEAVAFWSGSEIAARFPPNSALLGAIGAMLA